MKSVLSIEAEGVVVFLAATVSLADETSVW
jgi:hypothetical protein